MILEISDSSKHKLHLKTSTRLTELNFRLRLGSNKLSLCFSLLQATNFYTCNSAHHVAKDITAPDALVP